MLALTQGVRADESEWVIVRDTHEPIVTREVFEAVKAFRQQENLKYKQRRGTAYTPNIFKGKIFCGNCGALMYRQKGQRKKSEDVYSFHCLSNRTTRGKCPHSYIKESILIDTLVITIQGCADNYTEASVKMRATAPTVESKHNTLKTEIAALSAQIDRDSRLIKSLYESLVSELITNDEHKELRAGYQNSIACNQARIKELVQEQVTLKQQMTGSVSMSNFLSSFQCGNDTAEKIIDELVKRILVYPGNRIKVEYKFQLDGFSRKGEV